MPCVGGDAGGKDLRHRGHGHSNAGERTDAAYFKRSMSLIIPDILLRYLRLSIWTWAFLPPNGPGLLRLLLPFGTMALRWSTWVVTKWPFWPATERKMTRSTITRVGSTFFVTWEGLRLDQYWRECNLVWTARNVLFSTRTADRWLSLPLVRPSPDAGPPSTSRQSRDHPGFSNFGSGRFILAVGGCSGREHLKTVEAYSVREEVWNTWTDLNVSREGPGL